MPSSLNEGSLDETLRDEHIRVHNQNQGLLETIRFNEEASIDSGPPVPQYMGPYEFARRDENLIKFLLERVIAMREIPIMQARNDREQKNNIASIKGVLNRIGTDQKGFATKSFNRRGVKVDMTSVRPREGYDGE